MVKQVNIQSKIIPAEPRSKYLRGGSTGNVYSSTSISNGGGGGTDIDIVTLDSEQQLKDNNVLSSLRSLKEILKRIISNPDEASDENTFSAKYTVEALGSIDKLIEEINEVINNLDKNYLSKTKEDKTDYLLKFLDGIEIGDKYAITKDGKAVLSAIESLNADIKDLVAIKAKATDLEAIEADLKKATINDLVAELAKIYNLSVTDTANILRAVVGSISSDTFKSGFGGEGFRIYEALNGDWNLEIDNVIVRKVFSVFELIVQKITHQGGMVINSPNGAKITKVTDGGSYWKCEHDSATDFFKDDQILCQNFTGTNIKRYWRLATSTGKGYLNLSKTDQEANSAIPQEGDEIVVLGNRTNINRQSAIIVSTIGDNAPYTAYYSNINSYSLVGKESTRIGNLNGIVDKDFGDLKGNGLFSENVYLKGIFRLTNGKTIEKEISDNTNSLTNSIQATKSELNASISKAEQTALLAQKSVDELEIGGRNYVLDSHREISNSDYPLAEYNLSPECDLKTGDYVQVIIYGKLNEAKTRFGIWNTHGVQGAMFYITHDDYVPDRGRYEKVVKWIKTATSDNSTIIIYPQPNNSTVTSISKISIKRGNIITDWSPAPEDQQAELKKEITSVRTDFQVVEGQINGKFQETTQLLTESKTLSGETKQTLESTTARVNEFNITTKKFEGTLGEITKKQGEVEGSILAVQATAKGLEASVTGFKETEREIKDTATRIEATHQGIVLEASEKSAQKAIDSIEIGGRNLFTRGILNSGFNELSILFAIGGSDNPNGFKVAGDNNGALGYVQFDNVIKSNGTYTVSFKMRGSQGAKRRIVVNLAGQTSPFLYAPETNVFGDSISYTFTVDNYVNGDNGYLRFQKLEWWYYFFDDIKLEKGNKPTDWSPAPEDYDAKFTETNASLKVLNDRIASEVSKTNGIRTDLTTLSQSHNEFKVQVKSDVTDAIDGNNEVIKSSFEMKDNKIGLLGSEIDITGKVTFSALNSESQNKINTANSTASTALSNANNAQSSASNANSSLTSLKSSLGDLAYAEKVEKAKLGTTIIEGGFIKTELIKTDELVSKKVKTANSGPRFEMEGSEMRVYGDGVHPNMIFGVNEDGYAVLAYYTPSGDKLYDLGPSGINILNFAPVKWTEKKLKQFSTKKSRENLTSQDFSKIVYGDVTQTNSPIYYNYYAGGNPTVSQQEREREIYTYASINGPKIADGWYYTPPHAHDRGYMQYPSRNSGNFIKPKEGGLYSNSLGVLDRSNIYVVECHLYVDGISTDSAYYYFQENPKK